MATFTQFYKEKYGKSEKPKVEKKSEVSKDKKEDLNNKTKRKARK